MIEQMYALKGVKTAMTLRELAKEIKPYVGDDGTCDIAVWKEGRAWFYCDLWDMEDNDQGDLAKWEQAQAKDPNAMLLSAYENFANNTLDYITRQVEKIYTNPIRQKGEVENG